MSFPKGNIWQDLRSDCLDAIPEGCRTSLVAPVNLAEWQRQGHYTVQAATNKQFEVITSTDDFGSALLTDVEYLLDNATEHQVSLWNHINSQQWISPAWLGVTVYYWAFFLALATTRLTGRTSWFLTPEIARDFKRLAPVGASTPGAGCFRVTCGQAVSATQRIVILRRTDTRIHDEVWRIWFTGCSGRVAKCTAVPGTSLEKPLFEAVAQSARRLGDDWPSAFRNAINYRSGFAYSAVRGKEVSKSFRYLRSPSTYDLAVVLGRFKNCLLMAKSADPIFRNPQIVLRLLVDLTFMIHSLVTELHAELIERHRLDKRWRGGRRRFLQANGLCSDDGVWPL